MASDTDKKVVSTSPDSNTTPSNKSSNKFVMPVVSQTSVAPTDYRDYDSSNDINDAVDAINNSITPEDTTPSMVTKNLKDIQDFNDLGFFSKNLYRLKHITDKTAQNLMHTGATLGNLGLTSMYSPDKLDPSVIKAYDNVQAFRKKGIDNLTSDEKNQFESDLHTLESPVQLRDDSQGSDDRTRQQANFSSDGMTNQDYISKFKSNLAMAKANSTYWDTGKVHDFFSNKYDDIWDNQYQQDLENNEDKAVAKQFHDSYTNLYSKAFGSDDPKVKNTNTMQDIFNLSESLAKLTWNGMQTNLSNPTAMLANVASSLAYLNPISATASALSTAGESKSNALAEAIKKTGGAIPDKDVMNRINKYSSIAGGVDFLGNYGLSKLSGIGSLGKVGSETGENLTKALNNLKGKVTDNPLMGIANVGKNALHPFTVGGFNALQGVAQQDIGDFRAQGKVIDADTASQTAMTEGGIGGILGGVGKVKPAIDSLHNKVIPTVQDTASKVSENREANRPVEEVDLPDEDTTPPSSTSSIDDDTPPKTPPSSSPDVDINEDTEVKPKPKRPVRILSSVSDINDNALSKDKLNSVSDKSKDAGDFVEDAGKVIDDLNQDDVQKSDSKKSSKESKANTVESINKSLIKKSNILNTITNTVSKVKDKLNEVNADLEQAKKSGDSRLINKLTEQSNSLKDSVTRATNKAKEIYDSVKLSAQELAKDNNIITSSKDAIAKAKASSRMFGSFAIDSNSLSNKQIENLLNKSNLPQEHKIQLQKELAFRTSKSGKIQSNAKRKIEELKNKASLGDTNALKELQDTVARTKTKYTRANNAYWEVKKSNDPNKEVHLTRMPHGINRDYNVIEGGGFVVHKGSGNHIFNTLKPEYEFAKSALDAVQAKLTGKTKSEAPKPKDTIRQDLVNKYVGDWRQSYTKTDLRNAGLNEAEVQSIFNKRIAINESKVSKWSDKPEGKVTINDMRKDGLTGSEIYKVIVNRKSSYKEARKDIYDKLINQEERPTREQTKNLTKAEKLWIAKERNKIQEKKASDEFIKSKTEINQEQVDKYVNSETPLTKKDLRNDGVNENTINEIIRQRQEKNKSEIDTKDSQDEITEPSKTTDAENQVTDTDEVKTSEPEIEDGSKKDESEEVKESKEQPNELKSALLADTTDYTKWSRKFKKSNPEEFNRVKTVRNTLGLMKRAIKSLDNNYSATKLNNLINKWNKLTKDYPDLLTNEDLDKVLNLKDSVNGDKFRRAIYQEDVLGKENKPVLDSKTSTFGQSIKWLANKFKSSDKTTNDLLKTISNTLESKTKKGEDLTLYTKEISHNLYSGNLNKATRDGIINILRDVYKNYYKSDNFNVVAYKESKNSITELAKALKTYNPDKNPTLINLPIKEFKKPLTKLMSEHRLTESTINPIDYKIKSAYDSLKKDNSVTNLIASPENAELLLDYPHLLESLGYSPDTINDVDRFIKTGYLYPKDGREGKIANQLNKNLTTKQVLSLVKKLNGLGRKSPENALKQFKINYALAFKTKLTDKDNKAILAYFDKYKVFADSNFKVDGNNYLLISDAIKERPDIGKEFGLNYLDGIVNSLKKADEDRNLINRYIRDKKNIVDTESGEGTVDEGINEDTLDNLDDIANEVEEEVSANTVKSDGTTLNEDPFVNSEPTGETTTTSIAKRITNKIVDTTVALRKQPLISKFFKQGNNDNIFTTDPDIYNKIRKNPKKVIKNLFNKPPKDMDSSIHTLNKFIEFSDNFVSSLNNIYKNNPDYKNKSLYQDLADETGKIPEDVSRALSVATFNWLLANGKKSNFVTTESIERLLGLDKGQGVPYEIYHVLGNHVLRRNSVINTIGSDARKLLNLSVKKDSFKNSKSLLEQSLGMLAYFSALEAGYFDEHNVQVSKLKDLLLDDEPEADAREIKQVSNITTALDNYSEMGQIILTKASLEDKGKFLDNEDNPLDSQVLNKLINPKSTGNLFNFDVPDVTSKKVKSSSFISKQINKILAKDQARPVQAIVHTMQSFNKQFTRAEREAMYGIVNIPENSSLPESIKQEIEAKNDGIKLGLDILEKGYKELSEQEQGLLTEFFYKHSPWSNGRFGLEDGFNPQANKPLRAFVGYKAWEHTIDFSKPNSKKTKDAEKWALITIASNGFDMPADKKSEAITLKDFQEKMDEPVFKKAIKILQKMDLNPDKRLTKAQRQSIINAVHEGEEGSLTYGALYEYAKLLNAKENGTKYTHRMGREVDGINNGVFLTLMQSITDPESAKKILPQMGAIFNKDDLSKGFVGYKAEGMSDAYEGLARSWTKVLKQASEDNGIEIGKQKDGSPKYYKLNEQEVHKFEKIIGAFADSDGNVTKDARQMAKDPLMQSFYSAGIHSLMIALSNTTLKKVSSNIKGIIDKYDVIANDSSVSKAELSKQHQETVALVKQELKNLIDITDDKNLKKYLNKNNLSDFQDLNLFEKNNVKSLINSTKKVYGKSLEIALNEAYPQLASFKNQINTASQVSTLIYQQAFEHYYHKALAEQKAKYADEIKKGLLREDDIDLTAEQEAQIYRKIQKYAPAINPADAIYQGKKELENIRQNLKEQLDEGKITKAEFNSKFREAKKSYNLDKRNNLLDFTKTMLRKVQGEGSTARQSFEMNQSVKPYINEDGKRFGKVRHANANAFERMFTSSVKAIAVIAHSMDSAINLGVKEYSAVFNVHDANYFGYDEGNFNNNVKQYNKLAYDVLDKFDAVNEVLNKYKTILKLMENEPEIFTGLESKLNDFKIIFPEDSLEKHQDIETVLKNSLNNLENYAKVVTENKRKVLKDMIGLEQYRNGDDQQYRYENDPDYLNKVARDKEAQEKQDKYNKDLALKQEAFDLGKSVKELLKSQKDFLENQRNNKSDDAKGSSANLEEMNSVTFDKVEQINKSNFVSTFENMVNASQGKDSTAHTDHLRDVITNVMQKVIEPFALHYSDKAKENPIAMTTGEDMYILNKVYKSDEVSKLIGSNIMSPAELFAHEASHNVIKTALDSNPFLRKSVENLWKLSRRHIKPSDFMPKGMNPNDPRYSAEYRIAKANWLHIFRVRKSGEINGRAISDHLHEFVAFAVSNENFIKTLQEKVPTKPTIQGKTVPEKIKSLFNIALDTINQLLSGQSINKSADKRALALFKRLANTQAKSKARIISNNAMHIGDDYLSNSRVGGYYKQGKPIVDKVFKIPRVGVEVINKVGERFSDYLHTRNNKFAQEFGKILSGDIVGRTEINSDLLDLTRQVKEEIDIARENTHSSIIQEIKSHFSDGLSKEDDTALKDTLFRTDTHELLNNIGKDKLQRVLEDKKYRDALINKLSNELKKTKSSKEVIVQVANLANFSATGMNKLTNALPNIYAITDLYINSLNAKDKANINSDRIINTLNSIYSLYALNATDPNKLERVARLNKTNESGVSFINDLVADYRKKEYEQFKDNPYQIMKGYVTNLDDPNISMQVANSDNTKHVEDLLDRGYAEVGSIEEGSPYRIYINKSGELSPYLQGTTYLHTETSRGSKIPMPSDYNDFIKLEKRNKKLHKLDLVKFDLNELGHTDGKNTPMPILTGSTGNIVGYRHLMRHPVRETLLQTDTSFTKTMATMQSRLQVADLIKQNNKDVLELIKTTYGDHYHDNPDMFVSITPDSDDPRLAQIARMLPEELKELSQKDTTQGSATYGENVVKVRKDQLDILFGYRPTDIRDKIFKPNAIRNKIMSDVINITSNVLGVDKQTVMHSIVNLNDVWKEGIKYTKDTIVIKSGVVTMANTLANIGQLVMSGVNPAFVAKHYYQSYGALKEYRKNQKELLLLKQRIKQSNLTVGQIKFLKNRMIQIEDNMVNSPVDAIAKSGGLPNIVDDVNRTDQSYKYLSRWKNAIAKSKSMDYVPNVAKKVTSNIFAMHDSKAYEMLSDLAQFSDFGARYTRYLDLTKNKDIDHKTAMQKIMDEYIDYNLPTSKLVHALNSYGILWFTKYKLRIQKVLLGMFAQNPIKVLANATMLSHLLPASDFILNSNIISDSIFGNIHNPLTYVANKAVGTVYSVSATKNAMNAL